MLQVHDLHCERGERVLFSALSFSLGAGQCIHIVGENGAGKTSLQRIVCGLLSPQQGKVLWHGQDIAQQREEYWRELLYIGHLNAVKDELTVHENLRFSAALVGSASSGSLGAANSSSASSAGFNTDINTSIHAALSAVQLQAHANTPARYLSQGQRRRIALARLHLPQAAPLWVLDEPFTALDVAGVAQLAARMDAHLAAGGSVLLSTHQAAPLKTPVQSLELAQWNGAQKTQATMMTAADGASV